MYFLTLEVHSLFLQLNVRENFMKIIQIFILGLIVVSTPIYSWDRPIVVKEQSGFTSQTAIVGSRLLYRPVPVTSDLINPWMPMFYKALAYEQLNQYVQDGVLTSQGMVSKDPVRLGNRVFKQGTMISVDDLFAYKTQLIKADFVTERLRVAGVIDTKGVLLNVNPMASVEDPIKFSSVKASLNQVDLGMRNQALQQAILGDLFEMIIASQEAVEVMSQESTEYQSRKKGFFENFIDYAAGNFVKDIFFKPSLSTVQQAASWSPGVSVTDYFPEFRVGLLPYPYFADSYGVVGLNTMVSDYGWDVGYLKNNGLTQLAVMAEKRVSLTPLSYLSFVGKYHQLMDQNNDVLRFATGGLSYGWGNTNFLADGFFGLAFKGDPDAGLGYAVGFVGSYYPLAPIFLESRFYMAQQPDLVNSKVNWEYTDFSLGLGVLVAGTKFKTGYQWISGSDKISVVQGVYVSVGGVFD